MKTVYRKFSVIGMALVSVLAILLLISCPNPLQDTDDGTGGGGDSPNNLSVVYVSTAGSDDNAGGDSSKPIATIAAAVQRIVDGGEIRVAGGTYNETVAFGGSALINGSYNSAFTAVDFAAHPTIVDGTGLTGNLIAGSAGVVTLDRLILTSGTTGTGTGVTFNDGSLTITNCTITGNTATEWGGAGVNVYETDLTITDTTISDNHSTHTTDSNGGGLSIGSSTAELTRVIINGNTCAGNLGGGAFVSESTVTITDATISYNSAVSGGGGISNWNSTVYIIDSEITGNSTEGGGGGIYTSGDGDRSTVLSNVTFSDNTPQDTHGEPYSGLVTLTAITPNSGDALEIVTLTGEGFGSEEGERYYFYLLDENWESIESISTVTWSDTEIQFYIPNASEPGAYYVGFAPWIGASIIQEPSPSLTIESVIDPTTNEFSITSVSPTEVVRGETQITITGTGFLDAIGIIQINPRGELTTYIDCPIDSWSDAEIVFRMPAELTPSYYGDSPLIQNLLGQWDTTPVGDEIHLVPSTPLIIESDWGNYVELEAEDYVVSSFIDYQLFRADTVDGTYTRVSSFRTGGGAPPLTDVTTDPSTTYYYKYRTADQYNSTEGNPFSTPVEVTTGTADKYLTVSFNTSGGSPAYGDEEVLAGGTIATDLSLLSKDNYVVGGWQKQAVYITEGFDVDTDPVMMDMTLIAYWWISAPENLTATIVSPTSIRLDWNANPEATSYDIYRNYSKIDSTTDTFYVDTDLTTGANYNYGVMSKRNDSGNQDANVYLTLNPIQELTGSAIAAGTSYLDPGGQITYAFDAGDVCTRTVPGTPATVYDGTWEYSGDDLLVTTRYETDADNYTDIAETYNAGYTLDGGANLYPYGYERTAGAAGEIEGTWEFTYRVETTPTVGGTTGTTTYSDVTASITFNSDGTWSSTVLTETDVDPGTPVNDSGTWDYDELMDGSYHLVDFNGREFLHPETMPAYTRQ